MSNVENNWDIEINEMDDKIKTAMDDLIKDENWEINRMLKERNEIAIKCKREKMTVNAAFGWIRF